jgi:hypothetical protein
MASGNNININVNVNGQQAQRQLGYLRTAMGQFGKEVSDRFISVFSAVAVVKMGFDKVTEAMNKNMQVAKQISSLSTKFHIDPKEVHSIMMSAEQAGVSVRSLLMGMKSLGNAASKAVVNKDFANAFKTMGMDAKNLGDMAAKPAKHFAEVAQQLMRIGSETTRATVGTKLLGRAYQGLMPLIEKLGESEEEREKFLNNQNAMTAGQVSDAKEQQKMQAEMKEGFEHLVTKLMPFANMVVALLTLMVNGIRIVGIYISMLDGFKSNKTKALEKDSDATQTAAKTLQQLQSTETEGTEGYKKRGFEITRAAIEKRKKENPNEAIPDYTTGEFAFTDALEKRATAGKEAFGDDEKITTWLRSKGLDPTRTTFRNPETGEMEFFKSPEQKREYLRRNLDALREKNADGTLGEIDWEKLSVSERDRNLQGSISNIGKIYRATMGSDTQAKVGTGEALPQQVVDAASAANIAVKEDADADERELAKIAIENRKALLIITNGLTGSREKLDERTGEVYEENEAQRRIHKKQKRDENGKLVDTDEWDIKEDVVNEAEAEKHKDAMKKINRQSRHAETSLKIAQIDADEGPAKAALKVEQAVDDINEAEVELGKKRKERADAVDAAMDAESELAMAKDEMDRTAILSADGKTLVANTAAVERYNAALEAVAQQRSASLVAEQKETQATNVLTKAKTDQANALEQLRKAKDAQVAKTYQELDANRKEDDDWERKAFNRKMQEAKLLGKSQQEVDEETLEFEKKKLEEVARLRDEAIAAANTRAVDNEGEYTDVDKAEIKKRERDMRDQYERTQEAVFKTAHQGGGLASEMRKMGGGGKVFGGAEQTGFDTVNANRKKIPLLEKIEANTRAGRNKEGVFESTNTESYGDDFRPTD